jgi:inner membrane protein
MASVITHAFIAVPLGKAVFPEEKSCRFWVFSILCSILPDVDLYSFYLRTGHGGLFGHRGFTHSLFFALFLSLAVVWLGFRDQNLLPDASRWKSWLYFFLLTCSHALLDALTTGGHGVALFSPFVTHRYSFPWTPLVISPLSARSFFGPRGREVMLSELTWVWLPCLLTWAAIWGYRGKKSRSLPRRVKEVKE